MAKVDHKITVGVSVGTAYNQWTQFEEFPRFMEGVQEVHQTEPERLHWVAQVSGQQKEWYARITRQVPDKVIAWENESGAPHSGIVVIFRSTDNGGSEIELHIEYDPEQVEGDLKRFKEFIEERGMETGAWRGEIIHGKSRSVAPYEDSGDQPDKDQIRAGVSGLDVRHIPRSAGSLDEKLDDWAPVVI